MGKKAKIAAGVGAGWLGLRSYGAYTRRGRGLAARGLRMVRRTSLFSAPTMRHAYNRSYLGIVGGRGRGFGPFVGRADRRVMRGVRAFRRAGGLRSLVGKMGALRSLAGRAKGLLRLA